MEPEDLMLSLGFVNHVAVNCVKKLSELHADVSDETTYREVGFASRGWGKPIFLTHE